MKCRKMDRAQNLQTVNDPNYFAARAEAFLVLLPAYVEAIKDKWREKV